MSEEHQLLQEVQGAIAAMPESDRSAIAIAADALRELIKTHGGHGAMALALVGAEFAAQ
ncbi:hypothetical protein [Microcystis phage MACPNOA1]|nr:hypothetical protein [Microcystis phage MACPNOA1]